MLAPMRPSPIIPSCTADSFTMLLACVEAPSERVPGLMSRLLGWVRFVFRIVDGHPKSGHRGGHTLAFPKDRGAGHQHGRPRADDQRRCRRVDTAVHLHVALGLESLDQLPHPCDLRHGRSDEMLMPEPRADRPCP